MIELINIVKKFEKIEVLSNLSLFIREGDIFGILGKNGSGKSTLLKIISGLDNHFSGEISVSYELVKSKKIGVSLCDSDQLIYEMDCYTYLSFIGRIYKLSQKEINKTIFELADYFEFLDSLYKPISLCSTGTKKKILISSSLIHKPKMLVLDEPFESLDPGICEKLIFSLKSYHDQNKTVILTSNQVDPLLEISSKIGILSKGKIKEYLVTPNSKDTGFKEDILSGLNSI